VRWPWGAGDWPYHLCVLRQASDGRIVVLALVPASIVFGSRLWWGGVYGAVIIGFPLAFVVALVGVILGIRQRG
jgi:hypothetical protein